jgi:hypothetical protein
MSESEDLLSALASLSSHYRAREKTLREALRALGKRLGAICKECGTYYSGGTFEVAWCGPDERIYGHFYCNEDGMGLAHRSTSDDIAMEEPGAFLCKSLEDCPAEWLREIVRNGNVVKFIHGFKRHLQRLAEEMQIQAKLVHDLAEGPAASVSAEFERLAEGIGYERAIADWKEAQAAIHVNPDRAITLACTLLETVCKHVLASLKQELPKDQSIRSLFSATAKSLGLDPNDQAEPELRGLSGGLASVAQNLGVLRTRFGNAHGKHAAYVPLSRGHARLAVNAAGVLASFLMDRYVATKEGPK